MTDLTTSSFYLPAENSSLDEANSLKKKSFSKKMAKGIKVGRGGEQQGTGHGMPMHGPPPPQSHSRMLKPWRTGH